MNELELLSIHPTLCRLHLRYPWLRAGDHIESFVIHQEEVGKSGEGLGGRDAKSNSSTNLGDRRLSASLEKEGREVEFS